MLNRWFGGRMQFGNFRGRTYIRMVTMTLLTRYCVLSWLVASHVFVPITPPLQFNVHVEVDARCTKTNARVAFTYDSLEPTKGSSPLWLRLFLEISTTFQPHSDMFLS